MNFDFTHAFEVRQNKFLFYIMAFKIFKDGYHVTLASSHLQVKFLLSLHHPSQARDLSQFVILAVVRDCVFTPSHSNDEIPPSKVMIITSLELLRGQ